MAEILDVRDFIADVIEEENGEVDIIIEGRWGLTELDHLDESDWSGDATDKGTPVTRIRIMKEV